MVLQGDFNASVESVGMGEMSLMGRRAASQKGRRLEYFTIAWNTLEGLVAIIAGAIAGSISLVGFGVDSFIEVISGATLLWRMSVDEDVPKRERNEKIALRVVGLCFLGLSPSRTWLRPCSARAPGLEDCRRSRSRA
jgi:hypothetical protein